MSFDDADTPTRGELTGRTKMAQEALIESQRAHMESVDVKRSIKWLRTAAAIVAALLTIAGIGYGYRDRQDHYATKEQADATDAKVDRNALKLSRYDATIEDMRETMHRLADEQDRMLDLMLKERGHGR